MPTRLGGWLILVGIYVVLAPIRISAQIYMVYSKIYLSGLWSTLSGQYSDEYHPAWKPILIGELTINLFMVFAWAYLVFLYFLRKASFRKWFIAMLIVTPALLLIDVLAISSIIFNKPKIDHETIVHLFRTSVAAAILIPYMLVSRRARETFIE